MGNYMLTCMVYNRIMIMASTGPVGVRSILRKCNCAPSEMLCLQDVRSELVIDMGHDILSTAISSPRGPVFMGPAHGVSREIPSSIQVPQCYVELISGPLRHKSFDIDGFHSRSIAGATLPQGSTQSRVARPDGFAVGHQDSDV